MSVHVITFLWGRNSHVLKVYENHEYSSVGSALVTEHLSQSSCDCCPHLQMLYTTFDPNQVQRWMTGVMKGAN